MLRYRLHNTHKRIVVVCITFIFAYYCPFLPNLRTAICGKGIRQKGVTSADDRFIRRSHFHPEPLGIGTNSFLTDVVAWTGRKRVESAMCESFELGKSYD